MTRYLAALLLLASTASAQALYPHKVIKTESDMPHKIGFWVRVDTVKGRLPSKTEMAAISNSLRSAHKDRTRVGVFFILPGMKIDEGAFATAHHGPGPEAVRVMPFAVPGKYQKLAAVVADQP